MNYITPINESEKIERQESSKEKEQKSAATRLPVANEKSDKWKGEYSTPLSDLPSESPIMFDKSTILPLEELEVNYEWIGSKNELNSDHFQLDDSKNTAIESDYVKESFALSKKSSLSKMKSKSNLFLGTILSLIGALGAAYTWGKTTMLVDEYIEQHHYAFMAILVGFLAALGMRIGGRGHRPIFGIIAVLITILGCFVGNVLAAVEPIVQSFQLSYVETFSTFDVSHLWGFLKDRFEYVDIGFYVLGLFFAYYFSFTKPKRLFR